MPLCSIAANLQPGISKSRAIYFCQKRQAVHCLDVEKIVSSLSTKNFIYIAPGLDEIPIRVFRLDIWYYSFYYCRYKFFFYYQHLSWRLEDCWSVTNLERGWFEQPSNNRPIALLPILSKVCEKAVLNQLTPYLKTNKWLVVEQSRKKKCHSTETSLIVSIGTILEVVDKRKLNSCYLCGYEQSVR